MIAHGSLGPRRIPGNDCRINFFMLGKFGGSPHIMLQTRQHMVRASGLGQTCIKDVYDAGIT